LRRGKAKRKGGEEEKRTESLEDKRQIGEEG